MLLEGYIQQGTVRSNHQHVNRTSIEYTKDKTSACQCEEGMVECGTGEKDDERCGVDGTGVDVVGWFVLDGSREEDGSDDGKDDTEAVGDAIHYLLKDEISFQIDVEGVCSGGDFDSRWCPYGGDCILIPVAGRRR
mmetsp:Transcript_3175/g.4567  ORF Transcript_3175/g.4567 Transcript_3175/m.4567 type:complete len:136 (-) Transcript_3175:470-877(-)